MRVADDWREQSEAWLRVRAEGATKSKQRSRTVAKRKPREATLEQLRCLNSALWNSCACTFLDFASTEHASRWDVCVVEQLPFDAMDIDGADTLQQQASSACAGAATAQALCEVRSLTRPRLLCLASDEDGQNRLLVKFLEQKALSRGWCCGGRRIHSTEPGTTSLWG
eukprot:6490569-Amphidinium_carterae.4